MQFYTIFVQPTPEAPFMLLEEDGWGVPLWFFQEEDAVDFVEEEWKLNLGLPHGLVPHRWEVRPMYHSDMPPKMRADVYDVVPANRLAGFC